MGKKGGRPRLPDSEKKSARIEVKCYPDEKSEISRLAKSFGLSISDYMIKRALGKNAGFNHISMLNEIHQLGTELSRIGNNINQLSKHANTLNKIGALNQGIVSQLNVLMDAYIKQQENIRIIFRGLLRELKR